MRDRQGPAGTSANESDPDTGEGTAVSRPWFRMYGEFASDPKVQLLSFDDQRHFVVLLCLKCTGVLDSSAATPELRDRMIAKAVGLSLDTAIEVKRRLVEIGVIKDDWHPVKWNDRQYAVKGLPEGESLDGYRGYVYFIGVPGADVIKIGYSKNPWARLKELQTATTEDLSVVATVKTTETSEVDIHKLFKEERVNGEWFTRSALIESVIKEIRTSKVKTIGDMIRAVDLLRSNYATTQIQNRTEQNRTEQKPGRRRPSKAPLPDGFGLTPELTAYVTQTIPDCEPSAMFAKFVDQAKAGGWVYADWSRAFQTYVRNAAPDSGHFAAGQYPRKGGGEQRMANGQVVRW